MNSPRGWRSTTRLLPMLVVTLLWLANAAAASSEYVLSSGLEDDTHFSFMWPGDPIDLSEDAKKKVELLDIVSSNNEKFTCALPVEVTDDDESATGQKQKRPTEDVIDTSALLNTNIYSKKFCSYRIESYWIYELCHGQFVKQYHETKSAGKRAVSEEYFLGYFDPGKQEPDYFKQAGGDDLIANVHWRTVAGQKFAVFGVKYTDGTACEVLAETPREITIFYACDESGNDNIASFEEVSSCMYEMVVVTRHICSHPAYRLPDKAAHQINCFSKDKAAVKPLELVKLEAEQTALKNEENKIRMTNSNGETFVVQYKTSEDDTEQETSVDSSSSNSNSAHPATNTMAATITETLKPSDHADEAQRIMIESFVRGFQCLSGGNGWWKYEVCLGKHVIQFHEDEKTKKRTNILLGTWKAENHIDWLSRNPGKRPATNPQDRSTTSLYYSNGDMCEQTNKRRFVEVKFRCIKSKSHAVSLYLIEPATCQYLLAVESPWLCKFIQSVDSNGLSSPPSPTPTSSPDDASKNDKKAASAEPEAAEPAPAEQTKADEQKQADAAGTPLLPLGP